jgi:hypothetical protein
MQRISTHAAPRFRMSGRESEIAASVAGRGAVWTHSFEEERSR